LTEIAELDIYGRLQFQRAPENISIIIIIIIIIIVIFVHLSTQQTYYNMNYYSVNWPILAP